MPPGRTPMYSMRCNAMAPPMRYSKQHDGYMQVHAIQIQHWRKTVVKKVYRITKKM